MKTTYRILPVYTGDVSGVCSALYELGGMVVMHDPSGCNSTYNTHDETRWYDQESLIYLSGLNEVDTITGNDDKLIRDILYAAEKMHPAFIALVNSPLPFLNGTDFAGIVKVLEKRTEIPVFYVPTNGMHDYSIGAGSAFLEFGKKFLPKEFKTEKKPGESATGINLLGVTPLDFDAGEMVEDLKKAYANQTIVSVFAMGDSLQNLKQAAQADQNVVVSVTGLKLAEWMKETYGIPFTMEVPIGSECGKWLKEECSGRKRVAFIGEPIQMHALATALLEEDSTRKAEDLLVIDPLEQKLPDDFAGEIPFLPTEGEEDAEVAMKEYDAVVADPLYAPVLSEKTKLIKRSHEAFSGRCFPKDRRNICR